MSVALTVAIITIIALIIVLIYVVLKYTDHEKTPRKITPAPLLSTIVGGIIVIILIFYYQYLMSSTSSGIHNFTYFACAVLGISLPTASSTDILAVKGHWRPLDTEGNKKLKIIRILKWIFAILVIIFMIVLLV